MLAWDVPAHKADAFSRSSLKVRIVINEAQSGDEA
jgi:hypothetical protein